MNCSTRFFSSLIQLAGNKCTCNCADWDDGERLFDSRRHLRLKFYEGFAGDLTEDCMWRSPDIVASAPGCSLKDRFLRDAIAEQSQQRCLGSLFASLHDREELDRTSSGELQEFAVSFGMAISH